MPANIKINWLFQVNVEGGPNLAANQPPLEVTAYDVIKVTIPATTNDVAVQVQPANAAGKVVFFTVVASKYDPGLSYTVNAAAPNRVLDGPHLFVGGGAVAFMTAAAPQTLEFDNTLNQPIDVQVIVGRKV